MKQCISKSCRIPFSADSNCGKPNPAAVCVVILGAKRPSLVFVIKKLISYPGALLECKACSKCCHEKRTRHQCQTPARQMKCTCFCIHHSGTIDMHSTSCNVALVTQSNQQPKHAKPRLPCSCLFLSNRLTDFSNISHACLHISMHISVIPITSAATDYRSLCIIPALLREFCIDPLWSQARKRSGRSSGLTMAGLPCMKG